jgi:hypothetical protein
MNFAEFKPLDLKKSGPDLNEFLRLITDALEARESGSAMKINAQQMSAMLANGSLGGCLAVANSVPVGLQVWETGSPWFRPSPAMTLLRMQHLTPEISTPANHVQFLHTGVHHMKTAYPGAKIIVSTEASDQLATIAPNCGFTMMGAVYAA